MISDFPHELIPLLAGNLKSKSLRECKAVCKSWYTLFSPIYLRRIYVKPFGLNRLLMLAEEPRIDGSMLGDHVKVLYLQLSNYEDEEKPEQNVIQKLFCVLPNIQVLNIDRRLICHLQAMDLDCLQHVHEINLVQKYAGEKVVYTFLQVIHRLKDQIDTLVIPGVTGPTDHTYQSYFLDILPELTALKTVQSNEPFVDKHDVHLTSVLNAHRNLTKIWLGLNFKLSPPLADTCFSLESLDLRIDNFTKHHALGFMQHLPNLQTFKLSVSDYDLGKTIDQMNLEEIQDFAQYLKCIKNLIIQHHLSLPTRGITATENQKLWRLINHICGVNNNYCNVHFTLTETMNSISYLCKNKYGLVISGDQVHDTFFGMLQQTDNIVFSEVNISGRWSDEPIDMYWHIITPMISLLKSQAHRGYVGSLKVRHLDTYRKPYLVFGRHPNFGNKSNELALNQVVIKEDLLCSLGQIFPSTKSLKIHECLYECFDNICCIDLSRFSHLENFNFDTQSLIVVNSKIRAPIYIQFIDIVDSFLFDAYCYCFGSKKGLFRLENIVNVSIDSIIIKIRCKQLRRFTLNQGHITLGELNFSRKSQIK